MTTRMKIYLAAGAGGLVLFLVGFFVILSLSSNSRLAPFRKNIDKYLANKEPGAGGEPSPPDKSKLLPIDEKARDIDPIYFDLPSDIVAQTPEEVGVVARIKYATQPFGRRNQEFCLIDIYDYPRGVPLAGVRFEDRRPSVRGNPEDPDRRSLRTKMIEYFSKFKPGVSINTIDTKKVD